jgi:hypothetical protein
VFVVNDDESRKNLVHIFSSEEHFDEWSNKSRYSKEIRERKKQIEEQRRILENKDENQLQRETEEKYNEISMKFRNLSQELNIPVSSDGNKVIDLLREAEKRGIGNTMVLYDDYYRRGDYRYIPNFPGPGTENFRKIGFNDRASSLVVLGVVSSLHEHAYWKGHSAWFAPLQVVEDLRALNFDNKASSAT